MKRIGKGFLLFLISFLLGFTFFLLTSFFLSLPKAEGKKSFKSLLSEVRVITDSWGIPHIYAQNEKDLFFACGYVHAQERMWQMELSRRAGFGRLSEIFGELALPRDLFLRNLGLKEAAEKDYELLSERLRELLFSYSQGVNAWLDSRRLNWPPEFLLLRYHPEPWQLNDSLVIKEIMAVMLSFEYQNEFMRAKIFQRVGSKKALEILEKGIMPPSFEIQEGYLNSKLIFPGGAGSNNWVLSGRLTQSGKPLLANDPHLELQLPSIWFEIHLHCPTLNVYGMSLPGVPLVIIGHNDSIAWGMTYSTIDAQDLYIEELDPEEMRYRSGEEWRPLRKLKEEVWVRGEKQPRTIEISWTERGPLISPLLIETKMPISLRWTIYEGGRTLESIYSLNKAKTWDEFVQAMKLYDAPSQNFIYADKEGNIGYYLGGKVPLRKVESALFPFPGWLEEGSWQGFLREEDKPIIFNPPQGYIVTANNKISADDYPHYLGVDWDYPFRAKRIEQLILRREKHNLESMAEIQNDVFSPKAELFLPLLKEAQGKGERGEETLNLFKDWDLKMDSFSAAALYEVFMDFLHREVFEDELGEDYKFFDLFFKRKEAGLLRIINNPSSSWFDNRGTSRIETLTDAVETSMKKALEWLKNRYGDSKNWNWMKMHQIHFRHVLGEKPFFGFFNRGPFPLDGDAFTVRASYSKEVFRTTHGSSCRIIIDLSDFDNSRSVLASGQSGHFLSSNYDDQILPWIKGEYHPMLFSRKKIEENSRQELILRPRKKD